MTKSQPTQNSMQIKVNGLAYRIQENVDYQTTEWVNMQLGVRRIPPQVLQCHSSCLLLNSILFYSRANLSTWQSMWLPMISKFYTSSFKTLGRE